MKQLTYQETNLTTARASGVDAIEMSLSNMAASLRRWHRPNAQRRRLAELSTRQIDDPEITGAQRFEESSKPFWRALP